jgi:hypothetical protein
MWGWWYGGGGEVATICDCINEQIAYVVMSKVDAKLDMPWAIRSKIRDSFMKTTGGAVTSAVGPCWKAAYEGVKKIRPELEAKITDMMTPIVEAQVSVQNKITEQVTAVAKQTLDEKVTPHLAPLIDIIFGPVIDAFKLIIIAFDKCMEKCKADNDYSSKKREDRKYFVFQHSWVSEFWEADSKMWQLYDPLWEMRKVFDEVSPWGILGKARRRLRKLLKNALYTFETMLEAEGSAGWEACAANVRQLLIEDCKSAVMRVLGQVLFGVVEPLWEKLVIRPCRKLVAPLADAVPEALRDFVDVDDLLQETLYNILRACCAMVFEPYGSRVAF